MKAFPQIFESGVLPKEETGMDLRDYFAASVVQSLITRWGGNKFNSDELARNAYTVADSMMKSRENETT